MLLSGVAISSLGFAIVGFMIYLSKEEQLRDLTFWTLGSLSAATWSKNAILLIVILISYILLMNKGKALNALMLGEKDAEHLRSEEHTSELQSRGHLVCRLLLA